MRIYKSATSIAQYVHNRKQEKHSVGFAPTMGALHEGHMSLIALSRKKCNRTVSSIFVNPTQFNDKSDLKKYPRTLDKDRKMLSRAKCDALFYPTVKEIYPEKVDTSVDVDFGTLTTVLEGEFRPGHFAGVAQVVKRLLDIVQPDKLFMGQKDFQQFTIIQHMINELNIPTQLVVCPIIREKDGLAMSSRNVRLEPHFRKHAPKIFKTLKQTKKESKTNTVGKLQKAAMKSLSTEGMRPEYFRIVDGYTLQPVRSLSKTKYAVACTAVWAGDVRLIDNIILKK